MGRICRTCLRQYGLLQKTLGGGWQAGTTTGWANQTEPVVAIQKFEPVFKTTSNTSGLGVI